MNLKSTLDSYLGKSVRFSESDNGDGSKEVCDLDTEIRTKLHSTYEEYSRKGYRVLGVATGSGPMKCGCC